MITKDILKEFPLFKILNNKEVNLKKKIEGPSLHRVGLELSGKVKMTNAIKRNIIIWGTRESEWFSTLSKEEVTHSISRVLNDKTPMLIISNGMQEEHRGLLIEICDNFNVPLICANQHISEINSTLGWFLSKSLAKTKRVHASLIVVYNVGVLIVGKSGIGKSEAVLELIEKGHSFVSDDAVLISKVGSDFVGKSDAITEGYLETRGIGIIDVTRIYGLKSFKKNTRISLVVELINASKLDSVDRLGDMGLTYDVDNGKIDKVQIPVENGRSLSSLIEAAVSVYIARKNGLEDPLEVMYKRSEKNAK